MDSKGTTKYVAVDQYGETVFLKDHPRKELLEKNYVKHAEKMYVDTIDGKVKHVGYVIAGHWYRVLGLEGIKFASEEGQAGLSVLTALTSVCFFGYALALILYAGLHHTSLYAAFVWSIKAILAFLGL